MQREGHRLLGQTTIPAFWDHLTITGRATYLYVFPGTHEGRVVWVTAHTE
jgi:hypothetical protein